MPNVLINLWGHLSYFVTDFHEFLILLLVTFIFVFFGIYRIYKSGASENKKMFWITWLFTLLSLVIIYSGFEAYFRYRFDESDSLGFLNVTERWDQRHVVSNNYQARDDKNYTIAKTPGVVRISVMGDSVAWGYGIKNVENRFSNLLEKKLRDNGYKVEVYNFSQPGLDTWNEVEKYNAFDQKFHPDILLWSYFMNDVEPKESAGTKVLQNAGNQIPPVVKFLSNHSFFFDYVYWRLSAKYQATFSALGNTDLQQYKNPKVFAAHKHDIDTFTKELESNNVKIVVLITPFLNYFPNYPAADVHATMDKLFKNDGVNGVVDLLTYLKGKQAKDLTVDRYDSHPNEAVHALAADKLYTAIVPLLQKTKDGTSVK